MENIGKSIPKQGIGKAELLERMNVLREGDVDWQQHRAFSLVFHHTDDHTEFLKEVYTLFFAENGLNPMAFKSLKTFEHDVVRMTASLLNGGQEAVGAMTSGGTESIMLAVRTYRDRARREKPWIKKPEIVVPLSGHVAFDKAGDYFDVKIVHAPLQEDFRADVKAVDARINDRTIALVGSAPSYPQGVIDPIEELASIAQRCDLGMHVDACIGGFFLPWAEKLGYPIPPFDFRVPGVTSMSADLHKYGYAAKGASTVLYRSMDYLRHQFFAYVDWPGGVYASASMPGTRPGGCLAAAWASLQTLGEDGFLRNAEIVMNATKHFIDGINAIPELEVLGQPAMSVFAYHPTTKGLSCYAIADHLEAKGWHIDRQHKPECIHLMINPGHAQIADAYLDDLRDAVDYVKTHPEAAAEGSAPTYGLIAKAPMRGLVKRNILAMMEQMYGTEGTMPNLGNLPEEGEDEEGGEDRAAPGAVPRPLVWAMKLHARARSFLR